MLSGPKKTINRARKLRRNMSLPEVLLWQSLRKRPGGIKFRRQHPAGHYILDFFCPDANLAIEIDGEAHDRGDNPSHDDHRDAWLGKRGIHVLRIAAREVLEDMPAVIEQIVGEAMAGLPLHHPSGGSPPRSGED